MQRTIDHGLEPNQIGATKSAIERMLREPVEDVIIVKELFPLLSKHNKALLVYCVITFVLILPLAYFSVRVLDNKPEQQVTAVTFLFTGFGLIFKFLYDRANRRKGLADALASDISSIGRVFFAGDIIGDFARFARQEIGTTVAKSAGFAGQARSEDYFVLYDGNIHELSELSSNVVTKVTSFYTFLRASRDATGAIESWTAQTPSRRRSNDIAHVIYLCLLCAESGRQVAEELFEDSELARRAATLFRLLEIECLGCLVCGEIMETEDYRFKLVQARLERVRKLAAVCVEQGFFRRLPDIEECVRKRCNEPHGVRTVERQ
jgi:hypothetical protein